MLTQSPYPLETLSLVLEGGSLAVTGVYLLVALHLEDRRVKFLLMAMSVGSAAFVVQSSHGRAWQAAEWTLPLRLAAISSVVWLWGLTRTFFEEGFRFQVPHLLLIPALWAPALFRAATGRPGFALRAVFLILAMTLLGDTLRRLWRGWPGDLIESRRLARLWLLGAAAMMAMAHLVLRQHGPWLALGQVPLAALQLAVQMGACYALFRFPGDWVRSLPLGGAQAVDEDAPIIERVVAAMEQDRIYLAPDLTIAGLARQLKVPEHRLRRVINQRLGYRNFPDFINDWRIREASRRLLDSAQRDLTILNIALEVGFGSIGPFNRAFKAIHGQTPTSYRRGGAPGRNLEIKADS